MGILLSLETLGRGNCSCYPFEIFILLIPLRNQEKHKANTAYPLFQAGSRTVAEMKNNFLDEKNKFPPEIIKFLGEKL